MIDTTTDYAGPPPADRSGSAATDVDAAVRQGRHPLDGLVPDPSDMTPLCSEEQFAVELDSMVAEDAPRLFAVVQEYGERVDGRIAAWGMAFDDRADIVSPECGLWLRLAAAEDALRGFNIGSHVHARLVWFNPDAAGPGYDVDTCSARSGRGPAR